MSHAKKEMRVKLVLQQFTN